MASPSSDIKLLSVSARSLEEARAEDAVQQAVEAGWEIERAWRSGGYGQRSSAVYFVRLRKARGAGRLSLRGRRPFRGVRSFTESLVAPLRSALDRYRNSSGVHYRTVALLVLVAVLCVVLGVWAFRSAGPPPEAAETEYADVAPEAQSSSRAQSSASDSSLGMRDARAGVDTASVASLLEERVPLSSSQEADSAVQGAPPPSSSGEESAVSANRAPQRAEGAPQGAGSPRRQPLMQNQTAEERPAEASAPAQPEPGETASASSTATLQLASEPSGSLVSFDGRTLGRTPLRVTDVPAGEHAVAFEAEGYEPQSYRVRVGASETRTVNATLTARTGTLSVLVRPWGTIYINGEPHKQETDLRYTTTLPVGVHRVAVVHPRLGRWEESIRVTEGEPQSVTVDFNGDVAEARGSRRSLP